MYALDYIRKVCEDLDRFVQLIDGKSTWDFRPGPWRHEILEMSYASLVGRGIMAIRTAATSSYSHPRLGM